MDKMREEFEKWLIGRLGCGEVDLSKDEHGVYNSYSTGNYYVVWIESRKHAVVTLYENYYNGSSDDYCLGYDAAILDIRHKLDYIGVSYK